MKTLRLALIHLNIGHQQPEANRGALLEMIDRSAAAGAQIILTPEMALSGYSFDSRADIAPYVEVMEGPTLTAVSEAARRHGVYVCVALALREKATPLFTNSVVVVDPHGRIVCRYDKINAESRWACPGNPLKDNTFATPWGRVGLLICSDTYDGLMPRITALRGADLLLVPANWPPTGLNPVSLWRARAIENGFHVSVCNRTGVDKTMDCRSAVSAVIDPTGTPLLSTTAKDTGFFVVDLPLSDAGRLPDHHRLRCMADRRPAHYADCYRNLWFIRDLTAFFHLPAPGPLAITCIVPGKGEAPVDAAGKQINVSMPQTDDSLAILPPGPYTDTELSSLEALSRTKGVSILVCRKPGAQEDLFLFHPNGGNRDQRRHLPCWPFAEAHHYPVFNIGPAAVLAAAFDALRHPEMALAAAKQGCDLAACWSPGLTPESTLLAGVRTIENLAMAVCAPDGAGIWMTPEGHQCWEETIVSGSGACRYHLDTGRTRNKRFQDRVDFKTLLTSE